MERLLERLDALLSNILPLLYLGGLALGAAAYFSGVILDAGVAVGIGLACATEIHSFLQQRRVRASYALMRRAEPGSPDREELAHQVWVNGGILAALLLFSTYNSIAFVAETWTPAPGFLPDWLQIGIRGGVISAFFFLAGFLVPLATDAGAMLASASHNMLHTTIKATVKQWKRRVRRARRRGIDLAPVAVALMEDAGDTDGARRIQMIAAGLDAAESATGQRIGRGIPLAPDPATPALPAGRAVRPALALVYDGSTGETGEGIGEDETPPDDDTPPPTPPTGPRGGRPRQRSTASSNASSNASSTVSARNGTGQRGATLALVRPQNARNATGTPATPATPRRDSGLSRSEQEALWARDVALARDILASEPDGISVRELARRLTPGRVYKCHPGRAAKVRAAIIGPAASATSATSATPRQKGAEGAEGAEGAGAAQRARASNE